MSTHYENRCRGCLGTFMGPRGSRYCSAQCHLDAKTVPSGDCRVWTGKRYTTAGKLWATITHGKVTRQLRLFVADLKGIKATETHIPEAACGTPLCCNPDHYALRPRKIAKNKKD